MPQKLIKQSKSKDFSFKPRKIKIKIIGFGGGGCSIISEMAKGLKGINFLAVDTDQRSFKGLPPLVKTFQFGQEITHGWGTGMNLEIGEKAALSIKEKIKKKFQDADLIILISCLGGGISSGALPIFTQILNQEKKLSLGIFSLPFSFEGEKRIKIAQNSLKKIKDNLSGFIVLSNEEILKQTDKKTSLKKSLSLINQILIDYFQDLIEMISNVGIINIDFADLQTILNGKGQLVCFGRGLGYGENRIEQAIKELFEYPFFILPPKITKILFNIAADNSLGLQEVEKIGQQISKLNPQAKIIFGISQNAKLNKKIKITFLGIGEDFLESKIETSQKIEPKKQEKKDSEEKKSKTKAKIKIRKSGLEIKKQKEKIKEQEWTKESDWEIPSFLRNKTEN